MFAIFLCIAIGHAFGDLQRVEIRKEDLKGGEDAGEALSPYVKETVNLDQYLHSKNLHVPVQSISSNETETDEKPSSPVMRSPLTSGAYEVKKSGQKVNLETREADIRSLLKHSDRHISAKKDSMKFRRRFPITSAAIRNAGKDFAIQTKRSLRRKREVLDSFNRMLKPVFHPETHPKNNNGRSRQQRAQKKPNNTKLKETKKEQILDVEKSREQESEPPTITQSGSSRILAASYSAMQYLLNKLPHVLKSKMLITDHAEKGVLESYVKSQSVPPETLYAYNSAKKAERELLKRLLTDIPIILSTYKALRKGVAWNYTRFHDKFKRFFQQPSTALAQYESLKRDELASLDSFLGVSSQVVAQNSIRIIDKAKVEESEKELLQEAEVDATKEAEKEKADKAPQKGEARKQSGKEEQRAKEAEKQEAEIAATEEAEKQKADKTPQKGEAAEQKGEEKQGAKEAEEQETEKIANEEAEKELLQEAGIADITEETEEAGKQKGEEKQRAKVAEEQEAEKTAKEEAEKELLQEAGLADITEETEEAGKQTGEGKDKTTEEEEQKAEKTAEAEKAEKQQAEKKTIAKETANQNHQEVVMPVEDVEELKPEIKQTVEIGDKQNAEENATAEEVKEQKFKEPKIIASQEADERKAVTKAKDEITEKQKAEEKPKTEVAQKKNIERKGNAEEAEKQAPQEAKLAAAEEAVEQKAVGKANAEEAEKQLAAAEEAVEQNAVGKAKAEEAEKQAIKGRVNSEQTEPVISYSETENSSKVEERNDERKVKAKEAGKQAPQEAKMAEADDGKEQKAEEKVKPEGTKTQKIETGEIAATKEAERQNLDEVKGVAVKNLKQIKEAENKSKAEEANNLNEQKAQQSGKTEEPEKQKSELLEIADVGKADKPANEEAAMAEEQKAEERQGNQTSAKERNEPYCGPLKVELNDVEKKELLQAHNEARRNENATNMLKMVWDEELAIIAQYKANTCGYFHSMHKDCNQRSLGQNLFSNFMASKHAYPSINYTQVTDAWMLERANWDWETLSCHEGKTCTQWMAVTGAKAWRLGCGKSQCPTLNIHGKAHIMANLIVCNYGPFSMDFERGVRCSSCGNSTAVADKKGFACENDLCVPCDPKKNPYCKCGPEYSCYHGGEYSAEICGCICPGEYYGTYCEMSCKCEDINPPLCQQHASECTSESQKSWIGITCQQMCNTCSEFPRPASCEFE